MGLLNIWESRPQNLVWVSPGGNATWHLYQYGLSSRSWDPGWPLVRPICGAPSFRRVGHTFWADAGTYLGSDVNDLCGACIITICTEYEFTLSLVRK